MTARRATFMLVFATLMSSALAIGAAAPVGRAFPMDPIAGILDAFASHDVVALDEGNHTNEPGHAFRVSLIRDPRFAGLVNDIVVEFGNALYQDVADRFVAGDEVPYAELRQIWQNTGLTHSAWDRPIYEQFFREVRAVNAVLPSQRRLRVLLGDPPFDWNNVRTREDWLRQQYVRTDAFPAELIRREVLQKRRRALVIYGGMHLLRRNQNYKFRTPELAERAANAPVSTIVGLLERESAAKVFSIWTHSYGTLTAVQPEIADWHVPSLVLIRDTALGRAPFYTFYPSNGTLKSLRNAAGQLETAGLDPDRSPSMQEQFDAVLYLGPPSEFTYSRLSKALCADPEYIEMRTRRMVLAPMRVAPGRPSDPAALLKAECDRM